jgi:hypothetical protein
LQSHFQANAQNAEGSDGKTWDISGTIGSQNSWAAQCSWDCNGEKGLRIGEKWGKASSAEGVRRLPVKIAGFEQRINSAEKRPHLLSKLNFYRNFNSIDWQMLSRGNNANHCNKI